MGATMDVHHHGLSQRFSKWLMLVCGAMRLVIDVLSGVGGYLLVGAGCIGPRELIYLSENKNRQLLAEPYLDPAYLFLADLHQ